MGTITVLGAGNGGFAAAAHLVQLGYRVQLYNRSPATIAAARERGAIRYSGVLGEGAATAAELTCDLAHALRCAELVLITLPATALAPLARQLAPLLDRRTPVVLNPGNTGGALAVRRMLEAAGCRHVPPIGETNTLTYICRKREADSVYISSLVQHVRFAALPSTSAEDIAALLRPIYPSLRVMPHVLYTSLSNVNAVLHPPAAILAAAWIEHSGGAFRYYYDAGTPAVARVMADLDRERLAVGRGWGIELEPFPELFAQIGSTSKEAGQSGSFERVLRESAPNAFIMAPPSLDHRYYHEDIPFGLLPTSELGRAAGAGTPLTDALVTVASSLQGRDYRAEGWTLDRLGLRTDVAELAQLH